MTASGRAKLHSYVINHRPAPGFEAEAPYAIAIVELEEGPRMMTNIVGVPNTPEDLVLDMDLEVVFEEQGGVCLPKFRPAVCSFATMMQVDERSSVSQASEGGRFTEEEFIGRLRANAGDRAVRVGQARRGAPGRQLR